MRRYAVDTNVPIAANGGWNSKDGRAPSVECRIAAITFLDQLLNSGKVLLDLAGEVQNEYRTYLNPRGQPGVGDRFYQEVLHSAPEKIERIALPKRQDGEFEDLPQSLVDAGFDRSDRKFVALARRGRGRVANAIDSDWLIHQEALRASGVRVKFVCGCDRAAWFRE